MPSNVALWRRAWPASLVLAAAALVFVGSMIASAMPGLRGTRAADVVPIWGMWGLVVFGLPLLFAWALWSAVRVQNWAGRLGIYVVMLLSICGLCVWLFVANPPQM